MNRNFQIQCLINLSTLTHAPVLQWLESSIVVLDSPGQKKGQESLILGHPNTLLLS